MQVTDLLIFKGREELEVCIYLAGLSQPVNINFELWLWVHSTCLPSVVLLWSSTEEECKVAGV